MSSTFRSCARARCHALTLALAVASGGTMAPARATTTAPTLAAADVVRRAAASSAASSARRLALGALRIELPQERVVLGDTTHVQLRIVVDERERLPDDVMPVVRASSGSLGVVTRVGPSRFVVEWTPPDVRFPHHALLTARASSSTADCIGFASLPVAGKADTTVRTKPGSSVLLRIGGDVVGPVIADDLGDARVSLVVPPGVDEAIADSRDPVGNTSQRRVALGVPPTSRVALLPLDDDVPGDGTASARLLAFAIDRSGTLARAAPFVATTNVGDVVIEDPPLAPGIAMMLVRPGVTTSNELRVDLALADDVRSADHAVVRLRAGDPARVQLRVTPARVAIDDNTPISVELTAFDAADRATPATSLRLRVDRGRLEHDPAADGLPLPSRRMRWIAPRRPGPAIVEVRAAGSDAVLARATLDVVVGAPARLHLHEVPVVLGDDATPYAIVEVAAVDRDGNPLASFAPEVDAPGAHVVAQGPVAGRPLWRVTLASDEPEREQVVDVRVTVGDAVETLTLHIRPRPQPLLFIGPAFATTWAYGALMTTGPELSLLVRLPGFDGALHGGLSVGAWQGIPSLSSASFAQLRAFPVLAEVAWRPALARDLSLHLGASAGLFLSDVTTDAVAGRRVVETGLGGHGVAGLAWRVGPGALELDLRAGASVGMSGPTTANPAGLGASLGYRLAL